MKQVIMGAAAALACLGVWTAVSASTGVPKPSPDAKAPTLSLNAQAAVSVQPDQAEISLGVISEGDDAQSAMHRNREAMNRVATRLQRLGVERVDIQSTRISLRKAERYEHNERTTYYEASNMVTIKLHATDRLGEVMDASVDQGANQINGVTFSISDRNPARDQARRRAMSDLQASARLYAANSGYAGARLTSLSENTVYRPQTVMYERAPQLVSLGPQTPAEAGKLDVNVQVNANFELYR